MQALHNALILQLLTAAGFTDIAHIVSVSTLRGSGLRVSFKLTTSPLVEQLIVSVREIWSFRASSCATMRA